MAQTDRGALVALFDATDGPNWTQKTNWGSGAPLSDWHGVTANDKGRVVQLDLGLNNLRGAIPAQLGALNKLTWLDLSHNQLSGHIPPQLGDLSALTHLYLNSNKLDGPIPKELGALSALRELLLYSNQLSGAIPAQLGALTKLTWLNLSNNGIDGPIPAELGQLAALTSLDLDNNQLTGHIPPQLGDLSALTHLYLDSNKLDGPMPPFSFVKNPAEVLRWVQMRQGQTEDVAHSYAARAVEVLTSLWHFSLPVLDDATDLWLLLETFGGSHRGLWWTCLCVFVVADIERVYTAFFFVATLLSTLLYVVSCYGVDLGGCMSFLASGAAPSDNDDRLSLYCLLDSLLWTLFGSRARSSPFMRVFGLAGDSSGQALKDTGLGLHAIDVIVFYHPFRYFGEWVMSFPRGHRRAEVAVRNQAHRRKISMVRAVGETLWVDPLFLALSVVTGGWDDNVVGLTVLSALFSVLELVTELQYYVAEAEDGNLLSYAAVGDVEVGVGVSEKSDPRPIELVGPSHG